jgi:two-component system, OmpR family, response regulator
MASFIPMRQKKPRVVFVIEDEPLEQELIADYLRSRYKVDTYRFSNGEAALEKMGLAPQLVFLDYNLDQEGQSNSNGIDVLKKIKKIAPHTHVVMLTSQDQVSISVDCMKHGAYDYVVKGDSAFKRIENIFGNIDRLIENIRSQKFYKQLSIALAVVIAFLVVLFCIAIIQQWIVFPA